MVDSWKNFALAHAGPSALRQGNETHYHYPSRMASLFAARGFFFLPFPELCGKLHVLSGTISSATGLLGNLQRSKTSP
jgi:hypothetical protein